MAFATTAVQGRLLASSDSADTADTCGKCLPIMEGDDAVIGVRLYKTSEPADEYMANVGEIFTPFYSTKPGFISYTGFSTQDPDVVMFVSIYDTEANSAAAWDAAKDIHAKELHGDPDDELLMNYYGEITFTADDPGGDEDCVKAFDVGDYVSARMFYLIEKDRPQAAAHIAKNIKVWSDIESFDSYTGSAGLGDYDDESFFFELFNDQDDSTEANAFAKRNSNLDPTASLVYNVLGQVVFDATCSDDYPPAHNVDDKNCLPIMEGDDAVLGARLYEISIPADEYLANDDAFYTQFYSTSPGFISYTGVETQHPDVVMFLTIFDTVENSADAYAAAKASHADYSDGLEQDQETLLQNYYGTITFTGDDPGGDEDCVKGFDVGDYLSARMFYHGGNDRPQESVAVADNYKAWTAVESFDSYTASFGLGDYGDESFFFETFNDQDDSNDANDLARQNTILDPSTSLIYNVIGSVAFDSGS